MVLSLGGISLSEIQQLHVHMRRKAQHTPNACASCCYNMHMPNSSLTKPTNFRRYYIPTCSLYKHKMSYKLDSPSHPHICVSKYEIHKSCSTSWHVYSCGDTVVVLQVWWNYPEGVCTRHHILPITFPFRWTTGWRPWAVNIESLLTSGCGLRYKCMEDKYKETCVNFGGWKPEITGDTYAKFNACMG